MGPLFYCKLGATEFYVISVVLYICSLHKHIVTFLGPLFYVPSNFCDKNWPGNNLTNGEFVQISIYFMSNVKPQAYSLILSSYREIFLSTSII